MVSDNKEKLNNNEPLEMSEDELIKKKIEAIIKAKAKEAAKAKIEAEKKEKQKLVQELAQKPEEKSEEKPVLKTPEIKAPEIKATVAPIEPPKKTEKPIEKSDLESKHAKEEDPYHSPAEVAAAYAKYLKEHNLKPGDATFINPADINVIIEEEQPKEPVEISAADISAAIKKAEALFDEKEINKPVVFEEEKVEPKIVSRERVLTEEQKKEIEEQKKAEAAQKKAEAKQNKKKARHDRFLSFWAAPIFLADKILDAIDTFFENMYRDIANGIYKTVKGYRQSQKEIGLTLLSICVICGVIVTILDLNTVYEYAYNGKVLGYVDNQDDVTNVLAIAGEKLNSVNKETSEEIEFSAGDNITFTVVDGNGKDVDDADATVNKLAYMTDIEVVAYGIYDGNNLVTIVKSESAAENLLAEVKNVLGTPDEGMEVISVDFSKPLEIKPINILLTSVQSNSAAKDQMVKGGEVEFYHLVEDGETIDSIMKTFGVEYDAVYDENNENIVKAVDTGDKICIRKEVSPVSVELVEKGKMKEIVPFETIKKKSKKYYIGDEVVGTKGVKGIQIFEGTVTKVGGKVTDRETKSLEVIREKVDKVVYVGTTKRPKTAPTGIFKNPMTKGSYVITSWPGARWGRMHEGYDLGASTGTPVYASDGGTVTCAGVSGAYGNLVIIEHANGWTTRYGHLSSISVKVGDKVYQGQYIAAVGSTGRSTGPHLHFETRKNGAFVDPGTKVVDGF